MAWYRHHFYCESCDGTWLLHGSELREDDCPFCGERDIFPYRTDDRTLIIEADMDGYVVLASRETAEDEPDYRELGTVPSREKAQAFLASR
jgi:hypothetical protein